MLRKPQGMVILGEARSNHKEIHLEGILKKKHRWRGAVRLIKRD
jgi:hypothetical protein